MCAVLDDPSCFVVWLPCLNSLSNLPCLNTLSNRPAPTPTPYASVHVERARDLLGTDLAALVGESYERAYADMLRVQQLTELEEILAVKWEEEEEAGTRSSGTNGGLPPSLLLAGGLGGARRGRALIQEMWNGRLRGVQRNVEVWQALLRWVLELS